MNNAAGTTRRHARKGIGVWGVVVSLAVVATVVVGVVAMRSGDTKAEKPGGGVELSTAQTRSFTITTLANGELVAKNQMEIRNKVESRTTIVEIIAEGTMAKAGDLLIKLNDEELKNRIAEEELAVIEARTNYESAQTAEKIQKSENDSKLRAAESKLSIAKLTYQQWEAGDVIKQRQNLDLGVEKAQKNLDRLKSKWENSQVLFLKEFLSKDELDRDEIAFIEAKSALETAELEKKVYNEYQFHKDAEQKRRDVEEATAELERVVEENEINLRAKEANTTNRQRQLALRDEKLTELRQQFEFCTITAPRDGLVVYGSSVQSDNWRWQSEGGLSVGREVGTNDLLIALPDTSEMTASVKVHESIAGRVRPGQAVSVKVEAIDRTIPGIVSSVGVLAESGGWRDPNRREYTVKVDLNPDAARSAGLKPTMRCEARIELGRVNDVLAVPVQSVFNEGAVRYVLRPNAAGRFDRVPVMLGRTSDTDAEIVKGLGDGDRVLVRDPLPGEVEAIGWDETLLTEAGYILDENGKPALPMRGMPDGMPAIVPAAMPQGGQPAGGEGRQGGRQRPTGGTGGGSGGGQAGTQSNAAPAAKGG
jgi:HlyD family secretion protein